MDFGNPIPNYRYKGFHKFNYQSPVVGKKEESTSQNNGRVIKFLSRGVAKHAEPMGLKYGSGKEYPCGRRLDQRMYISLKFLLLWLPNDIRYSQVWRNCETSATTDRGW